MLEDPTPSSSESSVPQLQATLTDVSQTLWDRYKAMFKLRNLNTDESIKALAQGFLLIIQNLFFVLGLYCEDSALFRHEVAYVLGQVQSPVAIQELKDRLILPSEVRQINLKGTVQVFFGGTVTKIANLI